LENSLLNLNVIVHFGFRFQKCYLIFIMSMNFIAVTELKIKNCSASQKFLLMTKLIECAS